MKTKLLLTSILMLGSVNAAYALPALQLGGDGSASWSYDNSDQTWVITESSFTLNAFANCNGDLATCDAEHGQYAWDELGATDQYAYLVVAAVPDVGGADAFDVSILNDGGATLVASGYGSPPLQDTNSIAGHGIYDTYFEIYEFQFDGPVGTIYDQQPVSSGGSGGSGDGFTESFAVTVNSLATGVTGLHFDLFTVVGAQYDPTSTSLTNDLVERVAPFSHDAEYQVPAPGAALLLGLGLLCMGALRKKVG